MDTIGGKSGKGKHGEILTMTFLQIPSAKKRGLEEVEDEEQEKGEVGRC